MLGAGGRVFELCWVREVECLSSAACLIGYGQLVRVS